MHLDGHPVIAIELIAIKIFRVKYKVIVIALIQPNIIANDDFKLSFSNTFQKQKRENEISYQHQIFNFRSFKNSGE